MAHAVQARARARRRRRVRSTAGFDARDARWGPFSLTRSLVGQGGQAGLFRAQGRDLGCFQTGNELASLSLEVRRGMRYLPIVRRESDHEAPQYRSFMFALVLLREGTLMGTALLVGPDPLSPILVFYVVVVVVAILKEIA